MITFEQLQNQESGVAVVGLGYVGLPLAIGLARHVPVIGFDVNEARIRSLSHGSDWTMGVSDNDLAASHIVFSCDPASLANASVFIVAVPTPIDTHRNPALGPLEQSSLMVGRHMRKGSVVVYESTVYPGVTEDICVPILERESGLRYGRDFTVGYSPERINPGDRVHTLETVMKVVSGSDAATVDLLEKLYGLVVKAGIHKAPCIKVAEAAKVIENTQRDLNIALMNELSLIFGLMGIDTLDVLEAAGTKWNFQNYRPGLVGGHCIGVDPYYLTFKAEELGYHPQVILAGRRINDSMGKHIAENCVKLLIRQGCLVNGARVGIMGVTFKEDIPDLRNTRVAELVRELKEYGVVALTHDPHADPKDAMDHYGMTLCPLEELSELDALILAVPHKEYLPLTARALAKRFASPKRAVVLDVKGAMDRDDASSAGIILWRL